MDPNTQTTIRNLFVGLLLSLFSCRTMYPHVTVCGELCYNHNKHVPEVAEVYMDGGRYWCYYFLNHGRQQGTYLGDTTDWAHKRLELMKPINFNFKEQKCNCK